ncbi:TetR/AcrR family transcriptional regulator [Actinomadura viridis]|uniref:TetR/AcrR family transcriptional regulator n=1 Tax=Actinomadura viridis TaxID=58110 RepID=UPI0036BC2767
MRADARRNRERIVAAAFQLFAERGPAASMEEIAREAGLGVGTLYRHFPDRRALLEELAEDTLDRLLEFAGGLAREAEAAPGDTAHWDAFLRLVDYCAGQPLSLFKAFFEENAVPAARAEKQRAADAMITALAERAQKEGSLRGDIAPAEVVRVLNAVVCRPGARADDPLATVMLDGLAAPGRRTAYPAAGGG